MEPHPKNRHPFPLLDSYPTVSAYNTDYERVKTLYDESFTSVIGVLLYNEVLGYKEYLFPRNYTLSGTPSSSYSEKSDVFSLSYIPKNERTKEICIKAFQAGKDLSYVPSTIRDEELCLMFYKKDKENYKFIPDDIRKKLGI